ncbi:hypothetical protein PVAND_017265 [Polypedilum vanderplanki]|uniref:Uncharacterized protein n=1 Tax=Polypedilum vanderplanki TaxID=319348 RepID=A0A9J6BI40_POLVA|nr:hypothetical protein PVAND_017265 [Polypedilum vanderplanki]
MSEEKGILEKTKEKLIDAKDATKEKFGKVKDELIEAKNEAKIIYDEGIDLTEENLDKIVDSEIKKYEIFQPDDDTLVVSGELKRSNEEEDIPKKIEEIADAEVKKYEVFRADEVNDEAFD